MADEDQNEDTNEDVDASETATDEQESSGSSRLGALLPYLLPVGIALLAGAGGYLSGRVDTSTPGTADAALHEEAPPPAVPPSAADGEVAYYDLAPIVVNLNDPRQTRYLRATLRFAMSEKDHADVVETIEKRLPELRNWLIVYLANLSLEEVRGAKNLNGIRRDIRDSMNDRLWADGRPLINEVLLKDWVIQ